MTVIDDNAWDRVGVRRLGRGVNLSHWYSQVYRAPGYTAEHFDSHTGPRDVELIAELGFDHVRFPFAFELVAPGGVLDSDFVGRLLREVGRLHDAGLAVVVDAHPELALRAALAKDEDARGAFSRQWAAVAAQLSGTDPALTAFEVLNEPGLSDSACWNALLARVVGELRGSAPEHTVVASGDGYSDVAELLLVNHTDLGANIVLNMHHYSPQVITHQSAYFAEVERDIRGLEYPPRGDNAARVLRELAGAARADVKDYIRAGWGPFSHDAVFALAREFAGDRPVTCNEFGVFRGAPTATRLAWTADVVRAAERHGVGWAVWDYAGDFAIAPGEPGERIPDRAILAALGLGQERMSG